MMPMWIMGPGRLALIAAVAFVAGAAAGYGWEHRARTAEVAGIRADIARREAAAAEDARRRIETAAAAADAAITERDARLLALRETNRRIAHDIQRATTGRKCLSSDARSLLHQSPAFGAWLPAHPAGAAPDAAAAAADPGDRRDSTDADVAADPGDRRDSTDADVAAWALDAAELYEQCRARIDAIRQWDEVAHGGR